ncbi:MAG: MFS transporter [Tepidiformaceae bacterium]
MASDDSSADSQQSASAPPEGEILAVEEAQAADDAASDAESLPVLERLAERFLWQYLPESSIARRFSFQRFMASTFLSDGAREAVRYGALVAVVAAGGSAFRSALLGSIALVPPALLGLVGGEIADKLPRRAALAIVYSLQAAVCMAIPLLLGTGFIEVALLLFVLNVLGQVSGPTEQSLAPLVASKTQLGTANSLLGLSSNAGALVGTALLAPVLVVTVGVKPLFVLSGIMLLLAANRVWGSKPSRQARQPAGKGKRATELQGSIRWFRGEPAVATMVGLAVLAGIANLIIQVLAPQYVAEVLDVGPENTVYVFAPSMIGVVLALGAAPFAMRWAGERRCAGVGLILTSAALVLLGLVGNNLVAVIDPINPLKLLGYVGISLGGGLRTAGFLALPLGFGVSLTTTAVQTYINRRVPQRLQGRAFALQSTLKNGAAIIPLLTFGAVGSVVGVSTVLIFSPLLLLAVGAGMLFLSERLGVHTPGSRLEAFESFWLEDDESAPAPAAASG